MRRSVGPDLVSPQLVAILWLLEFRIFHHAPVVAAVRRPAACSTMGRRLARGAVKPLRRLRRTAMRRRVVFNGDDVEYCCLVLLPCIVRIVFKGVVRPLRLLRRISQCPHRPSALPCPDHPYHWKQRACVRAPFFTAIYIYIPLPPSLAPSRSRSMSPALLP